MSRFIGHYASRALVTLVVALISLTLIPVVPPPVAWPILTALLVLTLVLAVAVFAHNRGLCERCITSMPLAASAVAGRYSLRFRVVHLFERKLFAAGYLAAIVGLSFLSTHPAGKYLWAAAQGSLAYLLVVYASHQRLQPWCRFCENGGEDVTAPSAPTPVSSTL